jgi:hypothetical protein
VESRSATAHGAEARSSVAKHRHGHRCAVRAMARHGSHDPVRLGLTLGRVSLFPGYRPGQEEGKAGCVGLRALLRAEGKPGWSRPEVGCGWDRRGWVERIGPWPI